MAQPTILLDLLIELRLIIYEYVFEGDPIKRELPVLKSPPRLRTCRLIRAESARSYIIQISKDAAIMRAGVRSWINRPMKERGAREKRLTLTLLWACRAVERWKREIERQLRAEGLEI